MDSFNPQQFQVLVQAQDIPPCLNSRIFFDDPDEGYRNRMFTMLFSAGSQVYIEYAVNGTAWRGSRVQGTMMSAIEPFASPMLADHDACAMHAKNDAGASRARQLCRALAAIAGLVCAGHASAGEVLNGRVDLVINTHLDRLFVHSSGTHGSPPACGMPQLGRFAVDTSTDEGREMAQTIRLAAALGARVDLHGKGECVIHDDTESLDRVAAYF